MTNIVIIGRGRLALVKQAIESLYTNTDSGQFNAVFVSDQDDDFRCLKYLRSITRKNFMLLEVSSGSSHVLSQLKNIGAYASKMRWGRGDWLYFSDNDVWFSKDWLPKLQEVALSSENNGFSLWGGQIHPFHEPVGDAILMGSPDKSSPSVTCQWREYAILDGPSWLMRWNTWDLYGPFDRTTAPGVCQSEEYPFCQRLTMPVAPRTEYEKYIEDNRGVMTFGGYRIGVIHPHVVVHTGLSQTDGTPAPGAEERRKMIPLGVLAE